MCTANVGRRQSRATHTWRRVVGQTDQKHLSPEIISQARNVYLVTTPADHIRVALDEGPQCPPRFQFPMAVLENTGAMEELGDGLQSWAARDAGPVEWFQGVVGYLQHTARRCRQANLTSGITELHALVCESSPQALASGAWEYVAELGHEPPTDGGVQVVGELVSQFL